MANMDKSKLLKCPFCGREVEKIKSEYFRDNERLVLACPCGCRMFGREFDPYSCTPDKRKNLETELLEAWNRREAECQLKNI